MQQSAKVCYFFPKNLPANLALGSPLLGTLAEWKSKLTAQGYFSPNTYRQTEVKLNFNFNSDTISFQTKLNVHMASSSSASSLWLLFFWTNAFWPKTFQLARTKSKNGSQSCCNVVTRLGCRCVQQKFQFKLKLAVKFNLGLSVGDLFYILFF